MTLWICVVYAKAGAWLFLGFYTSNLFFPDFCKTLYIKPISHDSLVIKMSGYLLNSLGSIPSKGSYNFSLRRYIQNRCGIPLSLLKHWFWRLFKWSVHESDCFPPPVAELKKIYFIASNTLTYYGAYAQR